VVTIRYGNDQQRAPSQMLPPSCQPLVAQEKAGFKSGAVAEKIIPSGLPQLPLGDVRDEGYPLSQASG